MTRERPDRVRTETGDEGRIGTPVGERIDLRERLDRCVLAQQPDQFDPERELIRRGTHRVTDDLDERIGRVPRRGRGRTVGIGTR